MPTLTVPSPHTINPPIAIAREEERAKKFGYWSIGLPLAILAWAAVFLIINKHPVSTFNHNWPFAFIGFAAAIIANISAIGGGIIFIPAMIFAYQLPAVAALKIALGTQSIGMVAGSLSWWKAGYVPAKSFRYAVPGLLIGSTISSLIIHANAFLIKEIFGPVSIILGCLALLTLRKQYGNGRDDIPNQARLPLFLASIFGGMITGWISIGEGEIIAALLMLGYGVTVKRSIALGVVLLAINSIYLTLIHSFFLGGIPWDIAMFTALGALFGARMAPYLSQWLSTRFLKAAFASIAILDGCLFIYQSYSHSMH